MIRFVSGDILLTKADAIAHGVAPFDNFKTGLALSLRERWPAMYKDFRHFCKVKHPKEGKVWSWKGVGSPFIVNLMTQETPVSQDGHPGKATLSNMNHCFRELKKEIVDKDIKSLALTKISTGVGGLDWTDVKELIQSSLGELEIPIYVYETYQKDTEAKEQ
jgi:O-acetyl-ADP-ribose deacetylase (regulator of RNase III)